MSHILVNNGKSQDDIFYDLRKSAKTRPIIPFIGAGVSMLLGLPSWQDLVKNYAIKVGFPGDIKTLYDKYEGSYAKVTEDIFNYSGNLDVYLEYMTSMHPTNAKWHSTHFELVEQFDKIITTNYDFALENAFKKCHKTEPTSLYFPDLDVTPDWQIAYMHGQIHCKRFVFRESEYQFAYYDTRTIVDFLTPLMKWNYLLFIGFSFNDPIFRATVEKIIIDRRKAMAERSRVFGDGQDIAEPKSYIILSHEDVQTTISKESLIKFGIEDEAQQKYFRSVSADLFEIISEVDIEKEPFFQKEFKDQFSWIKYNINRLEYLQKLNFEILLYEGGDKTQIEDVLNRINQPEKQALDTLPDFSKPQP